MDRKFKRTGSVGDALHSGYLKDACTEENEYAVAQGVVGEPTQSTRRGALQLGLSRLVLHNKNLVMQKEGTNFPSATLDSNFCATPYELITNRCTLSYIAILQI